MMLHVLIPFLACVTSAVMAAVIFVRDSSHRGSRYGTVLIGGVAFWAHIGGFLAGVVLIKIFERQDRLAAHRARRWQPRRLR